MLPGRTLHSIVKQFYGNISIVKPSAKVITIEPSADALSVEEAVKLFSRAFEQTCAFKVVDKLVVNSLAHELTTAETAAMLERQNGGFLRPLFPITAASSGQGQG
jgi:hypothetical protein